MDDIKKLKKKIALLKGLLAIEEYKHTEYKAALAGHSAMIERYKSYISRQKSILGTFEMGEK